MRFAITHTLAYTYSRPVFLEPLTVRLRPRCDSWQRLHHFRLQVDPPPAGLSECIDLDGNATASVWFTGLHHYLTVTATAEVETLRANPFDYVLAATAVTLPFAYAEAQRAVLAPYCQPLAPAAAVADFARAVLHEVGGATVAFLSTLARRIAEHCTQVVRPRGEPWPAAQTLAQRRGACRDLAVLFLEACRAVGLAARFVSGYHEGEVPPKEHQLHAWAEVYLPGAGWRGYDPSLGLAVADRHVALAAGRTPQDAAPLTGTFRGTGATSSLQATIRLQVAGAEVSAPPT
ncbi:MAG: transglutaminase [Candidatus Tectimicrobiota bacterium]|nr:MAG: transglutaminase [Candidatus Tectomicrobia bacterium]